MDNFSSVYWTFYNIASVLRLGLFHHKICGILGPQPGIKPALTGLEGKVLTTGPPRKFLYCFFIFIFFQKLSLTTCLHSLHNSLCQAALVEEWRGIHLPVQGTPVRSLVWEDGTCCWATEVHHSWSLRA